MDYKAKTMKTTNYYNAKRPFWCVLRSQSFLNVLNQAKTDDQQDSFNARMMWLSVKVWHTFSRLLSALCEVQRTCEYLESCALKYYFQSHLNACLYLKNKYFLDLYCMFISIQIYFVLQNKQKTQDFNYLVLITYSLVKSLVAKIKKYSIF